MRKCMMLAGGRVEAMGKLFSKCEFPTVTHIWLCVIVFASCGTTYNMLQKYPDHTTGKQPSTGGEELRTIYILIVN